MKPIKLNNYGETLKGRRWCSGEDEFTDSDKMHRTPYRLGYHDLCKGGIIIQNVSKTHRVITCGGCGFRMYLPVSVQTFGDLREYCKTNVKNEEVKEDKKEKMQKEKREQQKEEQEKFEESELYKLTG